MDLPIDIGTERIDATIRNSLRRIANEMSLDSGIVLSLVLVDRLTKDERGDFSIFEDIRNDGIVI